MQNRILNVYLYQELSVLKLRIIEIHALEPSSVNPDEEEEELERLTDEWPIHNSLFYSLTIYNSIDDIDDYDELDEACYGDEAFTLRIIKDPGHFNTRYAYSDIIWTLPHEDEKTLLQQLGALDGGIHSYRMHPSNKDFEYFLCPI